MLVNPIVQSNIVSNIKDIQKSLPAGNYIFKVNNRNTRTRCEICSTYWTYFTPCSSVSTVNFGQVNAGWLTVMINCKLVNVNWT